MRVNNIEKPYMEYRAIEMWPEIMGKSIANRTTKLYFKQSTLFVHVNSSVLRHELFIMRDEIKKRVNDHLQFPVIKNIMIQ